MNQFQKTYCLSNCALSMGKWPTYFSNITYNFSAFSFDDEFEIDEIPVCMGSKLDVIKSTIKQAYHQSEIDIYME